jgi:hypothetical protein
VTDIVRRRKPIKRDWWERFDEWNWKRKLRRYLDGRRRWYPTLIDIGIGAASSESVIIQVAGVRLALQMGNEAQESHDPMTTPDLHNSEEHMHNDTPINIEEDYPDLHSSEDIVWLYITRTPNSDALAQQAAMEAFRSLRSSLATAIEERDRLLAYAKEDAGRFIAAGRDLREAIDRAEKAERENEQLRVAVMPGGRVGVHQSGARARAREGGTE